MTTIALETTLAPCPSTTRGRPACITYSAERRRFAYPVGNMVVLRSIDDEKDFDCFQLHTHPVTCCAFSPNGAYIASGDQSGMVLIWDTINREEHVVKLEKQALSGPVYSIDWTGDGERLVAGGEGKEFMGVAFSINGNNIGELSGHGKRINAVAMRRVRPFRAITASDDMTTNFYTGPPFRLSQTNPDVHNRQVYGAAFDSAGSFCLTCGSDKKIAVYDGKTGEHLRDFPNSCKGSIYQVSFRPGPATAGTEPTQFCAASADRTLTVYDWASEQLVAQYSFGNGIEKMCVAAQWTDQGIFAVTLDGVIHLLELKDSQLEETRTYSGHQRPVTSVVSCADGTIISGDRAGVIVAWNPATAHGTLVGQVFDVEVRELCLVGPQTVRAYGASGVVKTLEAANGTATVVEGEDELLGLQIATSADGSHVAFVTPDNKAVVDGAEIALPEKISSVAMKEDGSESAFGSMKGKIFVVANGNVVRTIEHFPNEVTALSYGPDGRIAAGDKSKRCAVFLANETEACTKGLEFHTGRVRRVCIHQKNPSVFASAGNDGQLIFWDTSLGSQTVSQRRSKLLAHPGGIFALTLTDSTAITGGEECCLRVWTL